MERKFLSHKKDWENFESNNKSIALNMLYVPYSSEQIRHVYISKHYLMCKNLVIPLMITDKEKLHYFIHYFYILYIFVYAIYKCLEKKVY